MTSVLVVAPHGMDEVLGCGGAIRRHVLAGDTVRTLVLFGDGSSFDRDRRKAAIEAAGALGTEVPLFGNFLENRSDTIPLLEIVSSVEKVLTTTRPATIYIPHRANLNIDHKTAYTATMTAVRPTPGSSVEAIYAYEILSSTDWASPLDDPFQPTVFVDIAAVLKEKLAALRLYKSDLREPPHSRSVEGVRVLARQRGLSVGFEAAEAFALVRQRIRGA